MNRERRKEPRLDVDILVNKYIQGRPYLCHATSLSSGGLLLRRINEPLAPERQVGIQFQLPGSQQVITCSGRVVREPEGAAGIAFTSIAEEHRRFIMEYIRQREARKKQQFTAICRIRLSSRSSAGAR